MQHLPGPEARIAHLEKVSLMLGGEIQELKQDTSRKLEDLQSHVDLGFMQAHAYIEERIEARMAAKEDLDTLKASIMNELKTMENRIIGALRQLQTEKE